MSSIRRSPRNSRRWQARYRDPAGHQRTRTFDSKADARAFLAIYEVDRLRGEWVDPRSQKLTVSELGARLLDTKKDRNTRSWNEAMLRHVNERWANTLVTAVEHMNVQTWVNSMEHSGVGPDTVRGAFRVLHEIISMAARSRILRHDPCLGVKLPRVQRREMLFLSAPQVNVLGDTLERTWPGHGWGILVRFAAYSGCRAGEIGGLRVEHLDLARHRCQIAGARKTYGEDGPTKTGRPRWVDLPWQLCHELTTHLAGRVDPRPTDRVWTGERGAPLNHQWFYKHRFRPVVEKLTKERQLPDGVAASGGVALLRFHDLRHTTVALLIAKGSQQYEVMEHLGHTKVATTIGTYGHLFPSVRDRIRVALEETWDDGRADQS